MRKLMLVFLMLFLPLQWSAALAADCCLRHEAPPQAHSAQMHGEHHDHAHSSASEQLSSVDQANSQMPDCAMDCAGCHAHHCAAAVPALSAMSVARTSSEADTPYLTRIISALADNLYKPPLARLV
jgi:hypothetical protein